MNLGNRMRQEQNFKKLNICKRSRTCGASSRKRSQVDKGNLKKYMKIV